MPEDVNDELEREAAKAGLGLTEFVREICIIRALGKEKVVSLYTERVAVVAGKGSDSVNEIHAVAESRFARRRAGDNAPIFFSVSVRDRTVCAVLNIKGARHG